MNLLQIDMNTGRVVGYSTCYTPITDTADELLLKGLIERPDEITEADSFGYTFNTTDRTWHHVGEPANAYAKWDFNTGAWVDTRTLQDLKDAQWVQIKEARSQAEYAGFTWDSSTFDSDAISQNRITGAVTLAQMSSAFTIDWILADNTVRILNAQAMCAVGAALGEHVALQFSKAQALRVQVEAATDQAGVEAVVW